MEEYHIPYNLNNLRLDKALTHVVNSISRSQIQRMINDLQVLVNGVIISDSDFKVKENDVIALTMQDKPPLNLQEAKIEIDVIYEDEDLIVINKAAGMTVHPGAGNHQDTLVNALLYHGKSLSSLGGLERPGIVHRLDKDTSGLMVVAKNNFTHSSLASQLEKRDLVRKYKALVWGIINPQEGIIKNNIGRSKVSRQKMAILKFGGKEAVTYYKTEEIFFNGLISLIECRLSTGRTHQIRVQLSHLKHSVVGDQTYGSNNSKLARSPQIVAQKLLNFKRQALHSWYMSFTHPTNKRLMEFQSPLPQDMIEIIT